MGKSPEMESDLPPADSRPTDPILTHLEKMKNGTGKLIANAYPIIQYLFDQLLETKGVMYEDVKWLTSENMDREYTVNQLKAENAHLKTRLAEIEKWKIAMESRIDCATASHSRYQDEPRSDPPRQPQLKRTVEQRSPGSQLIGGIPVKKGKVHPNLHRHVAASYAAVTASAEPQATEPNTEKSLANREEFQVVRNRKRIIRGKVTPDAASTGSANLAKLCLPNPRIDFSVRGLPKATTQEDIEAYLNEKEIAFKFVSVAKGSEEIQRKTISARIGTTTEFAAKILSPDFWPHNITVRKWVFKEKPAQDGGHGT